MTEFPSGYDPDELGSADPTDTAEEVTDREAPYDDVAGQVDEATMPDDSAVAEEVHDVEIADEEHGHPLVEETMSRLDELRDRPVAEHAEVYADLQERLQSALADADRTDASDRA